LQLKKYGLTDIILCVGYLGEKVKEYFQDGNKLRTEIKYSEEKEPLGTGGAIKLAENFIHNEDFLVLNGDSYLGINLNKLIEFHKLRKALATLALVEVNKSDRYGSVEIDKNYHITNFREKGAISKSNLINGGIYVFNKKIFNFIPEGKSSLEKDVFPKLIGKGFYGKPHKAYFIDIGIPQDYNRVQTEVWKLMKGDK
jgi:NDP-sugar pyrophosphorylase family protein